MSEQEELSRQGALDQDLVFADENGMPRVVSAKEAREEYEKKHLI